MDMISYGHLHNAHCTHTTSTYTLVSCVWKRLKGPRDEWPITTINSSHRSSMSAGCYFFFFFVPRAAVEAARPRLAPDPFLMVFAVFLVTFVVPEGAEANVRARLMRTGQTDLGSYDFLRHPPLRTLSPHLYQSRHSWV